MATGLHKAFYMLKFIGFLSLFAALLGAAQPVWAGVETAADAAPKAEQKKENTKTYGSSGSYLSGKFARGAGDTKSAVYYLRKVLDSDPSNVEVANELIGLLLFQGETEEAAQIAVKNGVSTSQESVATLIATLAAIKKQDYAQATTLLNAGYSSDTTQLWFPLIAAWLDAQQGKLDKPIILEEMEVNVGRAAPIVNYHLALVNAKAGFIDVATENFRQVVDEGEFASVHVMRVMKAFYDAQGKPAALTAFIDDFRKRYPAEMRDDTVFISDIQDGVAEVMFTLGSIMLAADVGQDASLYLQLALYLRPDMQEARLALGQSYGDHEYFELSNKALSGVPKLSRFYETAQLAIAVNLNRMKQTDEALLVLDALLAAYPKNIEARISKADLLRMSNRCAEAVKLYDVALEAPDNYRWQVLFARGSCLEQMGKWDKGEEDLRASLRIAPQQPDVLNYLGYSLLVHERDNQSSLEEAREMIEKALMQRPNDPQILDSQGWVLFLLGQHEKALPYLEKAVALLPADATVNDHLGDVYWRLERKTEARFQWDRARGYTVDPKQVEAIQAKLKSGLPVLSNAVPAKAEPAPTTPVAAVQGDTPPAATAE
jgi:tetratricopeptide (TPR) repeat protein